MGVCESSKNFRLIDSVTSPILIRMSSPEVHLTVGNICYKLLHPKEVEVTSWGKVRVLISKDTLEC